MTNQDMNNQNKRCYSLEIHKKKSENLIYEHYMDEETESKDT